jgi:hypothetical protein
LNGGILALLSGYMLKIIHLLPTVFLWRALADGVADVIFAQTSLDEGLVNLLAWRRDGAIPRSPRLISRQKGFML